ncbi:MAG: tellurite resistance TerB family protein [Deltaproteobacteria bacterium]|nr:tellurite resistance TerB family protein [Deltaproteobacteria bacterium]
MSEPSKASEEVKRALQERGLLAERRPEDESQTAAHTSIDVLRFYCQIAFLIASSDGVLSEEEHYAIGSLLRSLLDVEVSQDALDEWVDQVDQVVQNHGVETAMGMLAASMTEPSVRRSALAIAAAVGCVDGPLCEEEVSVFESLADAFDIDDGDAREVLETCEQVLRDRSR